MADSTSFASRSPDSARALARRKSTCRSVITQANAPTVYDGSLTGALKRYRPEQLRSSVALAMLSVYHVYFFYASLLTLLILGVNLQLTWFNSWFQYAGKSVSGQGLTENIPVPLFIVVSIKSTLLTWLVSELLRAGLWLCSDCTNCPAFALYRAVLTMSVTEEMIHEHHDPKSGFPRFMPDCVYRLSVPGHWHYRHHGQWKVDMFFQILIYLSLDGVPFATAMWTYVSKGSIFIAMESLADMATGMAMLHVCIFHIMFVVNDYLAKFKAWSRVREEVRDREAERFQATLSMLAEEEAKEGGTGKALAAKGTEDKMEDGDAGTKRNSAEDKMEGQPASYSANGRPNSSSDMLTFEIDDNHEDEGLDHWRPQPTITEQLDQPEGSSPAYPDDNEPTVFCAVCCVVMQWMGGILFRLTTFFALFIFSCWKCTQDVSQGPLWMMMTFMVTFILYRNRIKELCRRRFPARHVSAKVPEPPRAIRIWTLAVAEWGELFCGVTPEALGPQLESCFLVGVLQCVLVFFVGWHKGGAIMVVALIYVLFRRLSLGFIKFWAAVLSIIEALFVPALGIYLWFVGERLYDKWDVVTILGMTFLTQFGLGSYQRYKWRLYFAARVSLQIFVLLIVACCIAALKFEKIGGEPKTENITDVLLSTAGSGSNYLSLLSDEGTQLDREVVVKWPATSDEAYGYRNWQERRKYTFCDMKWPLGRRDSNLNRCPDLTPLDHRDKTSAASTSTVQPSPCFKEGWEGGLDRESCLKLDGCCWGARPDGRVHGTCFAPKPEANGRCPREASEIPADPCKLAWNEASCEAWRFHHRCCWDPRSESEGGHGGCYRVPYTLENVEGYLSILHFAKMSMLTTMRGKQQKKQLADHFPGWRLVKTRSNENIETMSDRTDGDWTTFIQLEDPANTTTVFVVRGTQSALDVMHDINVWGPVALTQMLGYVGPDMFASVIKAIFWLAQGVWSINKEFSRKFLDHVQRTIEADKGRRYYFTGYSLGGGIVKIAAMENELSSITFSSPGLRETSFMFQPNRTKARRASVLSYVVVPENDIVPRVDKQFGTELRIRCQASIPLMCHRLDFTYLELMSGCPAECARDLPNDATWACPIRHYE